MKPNSSAVGAYGNYRQSKAGTAREPTSQKYQQKQDDLAKHHANANTIAIPAAKVKELVIAKIIGFDHQLLRRYIIPGNQSQDQEDRQQCQGKAGGSVAEEAQALGKVEFFS